METKAILEDPLRFGELLELHGGNAVKLAEALGVSQPTISFWMLAHGRNTRKPKGWNRLLGFMRRGTLQKRLEKKSITDVAKDLKISSRTLRAFVHRYSLYPSNSRLKLRDIDGEQMKTLISSSYGSPTEICRVTGAGWQAVESHIKKLGLSDYLSKVQKESSLITDLANRYGKGTVPALRMPAVVDRARFVLSTLREFLTLEEIATIFGVTSSRVHQVQKQLKGS